MPSKKRYPTPASTEQPPEPQNRAIAHIPDAANHSIKSAISGKAPGRAIRHLLNDIKRAHEACQHATISAVGHAIAAGRALNAAKTLVGHGAFGVWLADNFEASTGLTPRTAQRYMKIARSVDKLVQQAREEHSAENPVGAENLSETEILEGYTITRALKTIAVNDSHRGAKNGRSTCQPPVVAHDEWLTPQEIVEAADQFLGRIHVDPCAAREHTNVPAATRYTADDDGLADMCVWTGNVFVNPGQHGDISPWVNRAVECFEDGTLRRAVLVLPALTDAPWTTLIASFPRAFYRRRPAVECCRPGSANVGTLPHPLMLIAVAPPEAYAEFADAFSPIADVFVSPAAV